MNLSFGQICTGQNPRAVEGTLLQAYEVIKLHLIKYGTASLFNTKLSSCFI